MTDFENQNGQNRSDQSARTIVMYDENLLTSTDTIQLLSRHVKDLAISRRSLPDYIADTFYQFEGSVVLPDGQPFNLDDEEIDRAFGNDGTFRWVSDFLKVASRPWRQAPQKRVVQRLSLIAATLMIDGTIIDYREHKENEDRRKHVVGRFSDDFTLPNPFSFEREISPEVAEMRAAEEAERERNLKTFLHIVNGKFSPLFWSRVKARLNVLRNDESC